MVLPRLAHRKIGQIAKGRSTYRPRRTERHRAPAFSYRCSRSRGAGSRLGAPPRPCAPRLLRRGCPRRRAPSAVDGPRPRARQAGRAPRSPAWSQGSRETRSTSHRSPAPGPCGPGCRPRALAARRQQAASVPDSVDVLAVARAVPSVCNVYGAPDGETVCCERSERQVCISQLVLEEPSEEPGSCVSWETTHGLASQSSSFGESSWSMRSRGVATRSGRCRKRADCREPVGRRVLRGEARCFHALAIARPAWSPTRAFVTKPSPAFAELA
jgi:hypothetical protein